MQRVRPATQLTTPAPRLLGVGRVNGESVTFSGKGALPFQTARLSGDGIQTVGVSTRTGSGALAHLPPVVGGEAIRTAVRQANGILDTAAPSLSGTAGYTPAFQNIWISTADLQALPQDDAAFTRLQTAALGSWGTPDLSGLDSQHDVLTLAGALYAEATNNETVRANVRAALQATIVSPLATVLELARGLQAYCIAASIINYHDAGFKAQVRTWVDQTLNGHSGANSLRETALYSANNWGGHARASLAAAGLYLTDLDMVADAVKGHQEFIGTYVGATPEMVFTDTAWHFDAGNKAGVNRANAGVLSGVIPEDWRRDLNFDPTTVTTLADMNSVSATYLWEAMQGFAVAAVLLHRAGQVDISAGDNALLRAADVLYNTQHPAEGDDRWLPFLLNQYLGTVYNTTAGIQDGKGMGWTDFTGTEAGGVPQNLTLTNETANSIDLNWDAVAGATSYNVYRSLTSSSSGFTLLGSTDSGDNAARIAAALIGKTVPFVYNSPADPVVTGIINVTANDGSGLLTAVRTPNTTVNVPAGTYNVSLTGLADDVDIIMHDGATVVGGVDIGGVNRLRWTGGNVVGNRFEGEGGGAMSDVLLQNINIDVDSADFNNGNTFNGANARVAWLDITLNVLTNQIGTWGVYTAPNAGNTDWIFSNVNIETGNSPFNGNPAAFRLQGITRLIIADSALQAQNPTSSNRTAWRLHSIVDGYLDNVIAVGNVLWNYSNTIGGTDITNVDYRNSTIYSSSSANQLAATVGSSAGTNTMTSNSVIRVGSSAGALNTTPFVNAGGNTLAPWDGVSFPDVSAIGADH